MSITAAAMSQLLTLTQERNYYQMQQIYWSNEHTAMTAKVKQHQKYETKWNKAFDEVYTPTDSEKSELKTSFGTFKCGIESEAEKYADLVCEEYDEETLLELSNLEVEYESMQQLYETLLEETNARIDEQKELVSNNAKDTGLIGGS